VTLSLLNKRRLEGGGTSNKAGDVETSIQNFNPKMPREEITWKTYKWRRK
jgi:hypothetical protein